MAVDLHIHSTASDGTQTPEQIVAEAKAAGLTAIAIADHDELSGNEEAAGLGATAALPAIPAVEISTDYVDTEVHVLGYWVDPANAELTDELKRIREGRVVRAERMVEKLKQQGVSLELEDVLRAADGGSVGRPHVARALLEAGYCTHPQQAFEKYIGKGSKAYVPRVRPTTEEAVRIVKETGGCAVLAHPGLVRKRPRVVFELRDLGVEGVEVYHPKHGKGQVKTFLDQARRAGLLVTGGSDSHGPGGSYPVPIGAGDVPDSCAEALYQWRRQRNG